MFRVTAAALINADAIVSPVVSLSPPLSDPVSKPAWQFEVDVQPHESSLRAYLRAVFPSLPEIDDLVQETYLRLIRAKESGRINYAKAFLFATARNAATDFFRRRKVASFEPVGQAVEWSLVDDNPDASEALNRQQELKLLAEAVESLPARCRQVMTLRMLYGMPAKDIASRLGISEFTAKAQLAKGMRRCSAYLAERAVVPAGARTSS